MKSIQLLPQFFQSFIFLMPLVVSSLLFLFGSNLFIWLYDDTKLVGALVKSKKLLKYVFIGYFVASLMIYITVRLNYSPVTT